MAIIRDDEARFRFANSIIKITHYYCIQRNEDISWAVKNNDSTIVKHANKLNFYYTN